MHHASVAPHVSQVGRTASSDSSGDKIVGMSQFEAVPQVIGGGLSPGPPIFRSPPGYDYPYDGQYHRGGPPPGPPAPTYSYYPPHPHPPTTWSAVTPPSYVEYITRLGPDDVLSGRGGATNSYEGNKAFRKLVKEYQEQYLQAKKRDKPSVASIIVELIRKKGGRFLCRLHDNKTRNYKTDPDGNVLWVDIGDDKAREKTVS